MFMVLIGSGLIADDISNNIADIYYSKLERYEYIIGKFGALIIFGNIVITLPFIIEFFLLFVGIGGIDIFSALPVLMNMIIISELFIVAFASIILAFSAITNRKLYAGVLTFAFIFITNLIVPPLAFTTEGEINLAILLDILTVLLISSYIVEGSTKLQYVFKREFYELNLASGEGIENWIILGALGIYVLLGFLIVTLMVYRRYTK
jgi:ABC-type transport system involved in multi-copper enzyme maturation permease subunit